MSSDMQLEAMTSHSHVYAIQVKECKNDVTVPPISNTPGSLNGAQFELMKSLVEYVEIKVLDS